MLRGRPVRFVATPDAGVPSAGVTNVGELDKTVFPVPVAVVVPVPPLRIGSIPVTPVDKGNPVKLVAMPDAGVPRTGVTSVGELDRTTLPVPVELVTPVPPFTAGSTPVTPVLNGNPVKFVATPDAGVPRTGVTSVGLVDNTVLPVPVDAVTPVPPLVTGSVPVTPTAGTPVAVMIPPPVADNVAPEPTTMVAVVFVPLVIEAKSEAPPVMV